MSDYFLLFIHALIKAVKSGCGSKGLALNSGWNWVPRKKGCVDIGSSAISHKYPSGDLAEKISPAFSKSLT